MNWKKQLVKKDYKKYLEREQQQLYHRIGTLKFGDNIYTINSSKIGNLTQKIYDTLTGIQSGKEKDIFNWTQKV